MHGNDVFKYITTALYYICNNKIYHTHKSAFQFKHAFNFEDLGKQMSVCKGIQDYTPDFQKRRRICNYAYICVSDCVYKGGIPIHSHLMCLAGGMLVCD